MDAWEKAAHVGPCRAWKLHFGNLNTVLLVQTGKRKPWHMPRILQPEESAGSCPIRGPSSRLRGSTEVPSQLSPIQRDSSFGQPVASTSHLRIRGPTSVVGHRGASPRLPQRSRQKKN
eukprot:1490334-Pyramimonas_sp.AAC.1